MNDDILDIFLIRKLFYCINHEKYARMQYRTRLEYEFFMEF